jgi:hypothetical protein
MNVHAIEKTAQKVALLLGGDLCQLRGGRRVAGQSPLA